MKENNDQRVDHDATSKWIAENFCRTQGHNLVVFKQWPHWWKPLDFVMCSHCGMDIDEIREGTLYL